MKTRISLFISAVAIVTLSFTFSSLSKPSQKMEARTTSASVSTPVGGFVADEIVK